MMLFSYACKIVSNGCVFVNHNRAEPLWKIKVPKIDFKANPHSWPSALRLQNQTALQRALSIKKVVKFGGGYAVLVPTDWVEVYCDEIEGRHWVELTFNGKEVGFTRREGESWHAVRHSVITGLKVEGGLDGDTTSRWIGWKISQSGASPMFDIHFDA